MRFFMRKSNHRRNMPLDYAVGLVREICLMADTSLFDATETSLVELGIADAVARKDNAVLFDWFVETLNFQGVSDTIAASYLDAHGSVTFEQIGAGFKIANPCPKLRSYWHFEGCGYRKSLGSCALPQNFHQCPLPRHIMRNGSLNQAAYSLFLFLRDVTDGDLVGWLDRRLAEADIGPPRGRAERLAAAVIEPMTYIHGVSHKVLNMSLSALLMAAGPQRERWRSAANAMITVDTLIHNWLHRTGLLRHVNARHNYGPQCYRPGGCATIVRQISDRIDVRRYDASFPKHVPRFVEYCLWWFCAERGFNQCNGNRIDDGHRCRLNDCPLFAKCGVASHCASRIGIQAVQADAAITYRMRP
jgi:hypothetical protein